MAPSAAAYAAPWLSAVSRVRYDAASAAISGSPVERAPALSEIAPWNRPLADTVTPETRDATPDTRPVSIRSGPVNGVAELSPSAVWASVAVPARAAVAAAVSVPLRKVRRFMAFESTGGPWSRYLRT